MAITPHAILALLWLLATAASTLEHDLSLDIQGDRAIVAPSNGFNPQHTLLAQLAHDGSVVSLDLAPYAVSVFPLSSHCQSVALLRPGCSELSTACMLALQCRSEEAKMVVAGVTCQSPTQRAAADPSLVHQRMARS
jgi:hypothetical protein